MEKANAYHRDIYSGMVASQLGKEGYFGEECRVYGFLCWEESNEPQFYWAEEELKCAEQYLQKIYQDCWITPYSSCGERIYTGKDKGLAQQKEALEKRLKETYACCYKKIAAKHENLIQKPKRKSTIFNGTEQKQLQQEGKKLYGFVWSGQGHKACYSNVFLPATLQKWFEKQTQGYDCSSIVIQNLAVWNVNALQQEKERFRQELLELFPMTSQAWRFEKLLAPCTNQNSMVK